MISLRNIFGKKDEPINSYKDFWNWFQKNEKTFFKIVKENNDVEKNFLDQLTPKTINIKSGIFFLTGMCSDDTAELVFTADGNVKNFVFIEEFVDAAPTLAGWKFTALKPELDINDVNIEMNGFLFSQNNIHFYANNVANMPDEIDITIVHDDLNNENKKIVGHGIYIFLDNYLGELNFATSIDSVEVLGRQGIKEELIPINKLKDYLIWRQKEFIEKYDGTKYDTENGGHTVFEANTKNGQRVLAVINTDLLAWDNKASHPWIVEIRLKYDGSSNNGLPNDSTYETLNKIEEELMLYLKDYDGYLLIGRETGENLRTVFIACKEFRKPSKVVDDIIKKHANKFEIEFDIYKDKYWRSFGRFTQKL